MDQFAPNSGKSDLYSSKDTIPHDTCEAIFRAAELGQLGPKKHAQDHQDGKFLFEGRRFFSRTEAACGTLMERFIPDYKIVDGKTFQVPIGADKFDHMRHVDFMVAGVLIEFHQVRFWKNTRRCGDFESFKDYCEYKRQMRELPVEQRQAFLELTQTRLLHNYTAKREAQIAACPEHAGRELIVARSASDFYHRVIRRFGEDIPDEKAFLRMYHRICERTEDLNEHSGNARPEWRSRHNHPYRSGKGRQRR
jgi:hypothetical protein